MDKERDAQWDKASGREKDLLLIISDIYNIHLKIAGLLGGGIISSELYMSTYEETYKVRKAIREYIKKLKEADDEKT